MGKVFQIKGLARAKASLVGSKAGSRDPSGAVGVAGTRFKKRMVRHEAEAVPGAMS